MQTMLRLTDHVSVDLDVRRTARGRWTQVFMGPDRLDHGRWYALKTVRPAFLAHWPQLREVFVRQALRWCGRWPHPNLVTAHVVVEIARQPFVVLDDAGGGTLRDWLGCVRPAVGPHR
jgi:hypothetical protein